MASRKKILLPRSDIPNRAPTVNEIDFGEIAVYMGRIITYISFALCHLGFSHALVGICQRSDTTFFPVDVLVSKQLPRKIC